MNLIQLIACIGLITGCFVLLHISPMDFTEGVFRRITSKPKSIRSEVNESTRRKKKSFLRREIEETQTILRMTGRAAKFPMVCALSLLLFLVGAAFALTLGNLFLVPVLAVGMMFVPFWFIRLTANHYKKNIAAELETALSNVVFPVIDLVLAVFFFAKLGMAYFDYRKHGQFEWTAPAILFACLIFTLTAPTYVWTILGM